MTALATTGATTDADAVAVSPNPAYRPDIDGLRALAVSAVVLFHAGLAWLPGGFIGVDVFFAISGYLIGGHIYAEAAAGRFRFGAFYARRVRRILPALFCLLTCLYAAGLLLMTPLELREFGKEAVATVFGVSNVLFYTGGGYFAPTAELNPLLMTWSLGVEEQFYVLFPFVMLAALRIGRTWALPTIALLSVVSFAASLAAMRLDPKAAFYLLPPRAWELGVGTILALWERRPAARALERRIAEPVAAAGAALIAAGLLTYRPGIAFPGWFAVLPVVGTALVIAGRRSTINATALSLPPVVFVGRVSYSWYLWHWPVFYLNRMLASGGASLPAPLLVVGSLILAVLSWRFVEQPLRRRVLPQPVVLRRYAIAAALVALPAGVMLYRAGLPGRLPAPARALADEAMRARANPCLASFGATVPRNLSTCVVAAGTRPRLVVLGDSHASALAPGFADRSARQGLAFGEMTKSSCPALWDFAAPSERAGHETECRAFQRAAFSRVASDAAMRTIVLAGYWSENRQVVDAAGRTVPLSVALDRTVARIETLGRRVILVQDVPTFAFDPYARVIGRALPARAALQRAIGTTADQGFAAPSLPDPARPIIAAVGRHHPRAMLLDPPAALCAREKCRYGTQEALYYFDFQHLTRSGAAAALQPSGGRRER